MSARGARGAPGAVSRGTEHSARCLPAVRAEPAGTVAAVVMSDSAGVNLGTLSPHPSGLSNMGTMMNMGTTMTATSFSLCHENVTRFCKYARRL